jgi:hypothetical protein
LEKDVFGRSDASCFEKKNVNVLCLLPLFAFYFLLKNVKLIMFSCLSCFLAIFLSLLEAGFSSSNVAIIDEL